MPVSKQPLVERIARVLAGAAHSSNAEGSDPSAAEKVDLAWREHLNQALAWPRPATRTPGSAWSKPLFSRWKRPPTEQRLWSPKNRKAARSPGRPFHCPAGCGLTLSDNPRGGCAHQNRNRLMTMRHQTTSFQLLNDAVKMGGLQDYSRVSATYNC
jgi:hypothetical protein